jgi:hypothetical protein
LKYLLNTTVISCCGLCWDADVIGVMTGMSVDREYVRDGKITKMVVVELTDHR